MPKLSSGRRDQARQDMRIQVTAIWEENEGVNSDIFATLLERNGIGLGKSMHKGEPALQRWK